MENTGLAQLARVAFCLILFLSEVCRCYPISYLASGDEIPEQGLKELVEDWEREGIIRPIPFPIRAVVGAADTYYTGQAMTRKSLRSGGNSNLRLRYGKRNILPSYELVGLAAAADARGTGGSAIGDLNGNTAAQN